MNSSVKKLKDSDPKHRPPTPFPMEILGDPEPQMFNPPTPPPLPPRRITPTFAPVDSHNPRRIPMTSTPVVDSPPPKFLQQACSTTLKPLEHLTRPMNKLLIPRDLLHTFSPTSVLTLPTIKGRPWFETILDHPQAPMHFIPRTCVGSACTYHFYPKYYGSEECTCIDESDLKLDVKDLLSRVHRTVDQEWLEEAIFFEGPLNWVTGMPKNLEEKTERDMEVEEEALDWEILHSTKWVSDLFTLLKDNEVIHFWKEAWEPTAGRPSLSAQLTRAHENVERHKNYLMDSWKNMSPNHKFLTRMMAGGMMDDVQFNGSVNPFTGKPLQPGETLTSTLEKEWRESCFKRAHAMTHMNLLEETLAFLTDMISQEQVANGLKDLQIIVGTKMEKDCPDVEEENIFFQTAMATLVLQWELNFRKESLKLDISHLIGRLEKIRERLEDINFNGQLEELVRYDEENCCSALKTTRGCHVKEPLTTMEEKQMLMGVFFFTAAQQIPLLQNSLRRTLILEEIFQRLSTQILHKMTTFPSLRYSQLIPLDFNMDKFMTRCLLEGQSIPRCRQILARLTGRANHECSGFIQACLTKDFARF
jgi:hypothetical protein